VTCARCMTRMVPYSCCLAILSCQYLTKPWSMSHRTISYPTEMDKRQKYHLPSAVGEAFVSLGKVTTP
jgi:hypothetical protein